MQETKISFETAVLAKEKNFNIGCDYYYIVYKKTYVYENNPTHPNSYTKDSIEIMSGYFINNSKHSDYSNNICDCYGLPNQSLIQKWLRELFNLKVCVDWCDGDDKYYWRLNNARITTEGFDCYEAALEEGLFYSLKKI